MTDPVVTVLGGIVLMFASGTVGKYLGANGKVKTEQCEERRTNCLNLVSEKIDNLTKTVGVMQTTLDRMSNNKNV